MIWELMDPQRAIPIVHRTRILFFLVLLALYVFSPFDVIPEGVVGLVGLLDDVLVIVMVLFYLAMLYRSTLILHHGGHHQ
jgi:RING finger protein 170